MWEGRVRAIHIAAEESAPAFAIEEANIVPGLGIEGDRGFKWAQDNPDKMEAKNEITLIESEALIALDREYGVQLTAAESRRQIETEAAPLNHLVGREFRVGETVLRGTELCEPCGYLQKLTVDGVIKGLRHRGGLRAQIISGGTIRPGDPIRPMPASG